VTPPVVFLPLMRLASDPVDKRHQSHMDDLLARTRAQLRRPEMPDEMPVDYTDSPQVRNLKDNINALVDEKHALVAANERLATELKACIAEKGELQKQLALKSGLGIHENRPETFADLKKAAHTDEQ
jgi:hypothetical protein